MYLYSGYVISSNSLHPFTTIMLIVVRQCFNIKMSSIHQLSLMNPVEYIGIIWEGGDNGVHILWKRRNVFVGERRRIWTSISPSYVGDRAVWGRCWAQVNWQVLDSAAALFTAPGDTHIHYRHLGKGHREKWRAAANCLSITLLSFHVAKSVTAVNQRPGQWLNIWHVIFINPHSWRL